MTLREKLAAEPLKLPTHRCIVMRLADELSADDYDFIVSEIERPASDPERRSASILVRVLASEGIDVKSTALMKHRRGECGCRT